MKLDFTEIIVAVISSGVAIELFRWIVDLWDRKRGFARTLDIMFDVQDSLNKIMEETAGSRVSLILATNGGDVPAVDRPWSITILFDTTSPPLKSVKSDYKSYPVDMEYRQMLADLKINQKITIYTSDFNAMLRNMHEPFSITQTDAALLEMGKNWMTFIMVDYIEDRENDIQQGQQLDVITNRLKRIKLSKVLKNLKVDEKKLT